MGPRFAPLLLLIPLLLSLATPSAAQPTSAARLLFLRHGDLWSAARDGSGQTILLGASGTIQRYALAPAGHKVAVVRRVGALDALEIHSLLDQSRILVRAADGFIDSLAWSLDADPLLGYTYTPDRQTPLRLYVTKSGEGIQRHRLSAEERLLYTFPAPTGVVIVTKQASGLIWTHATLNQAETIGGFPGKTITAMPLSSTQWLTSLYNPGIGRSLALMEATPRGFVETVRTDTPRADFSWSAQPAFRPERGEVLRVVVREDLSGLEQAPTSNILIWELARNQVRRIPLTGQVQLGAPIAEPGGTMVAWCAQFQDGSGYGTAPAIWGLDWRGEERRLLVAEGQDPAWWIGPPAPVPGPAISDPTAP